MRCLQARRHNFQIPGNRFASRPQARDRSSSRSSTHTVSMTKGHKGHGSQEGNGAPSTEPEDISNNNNVFPDSADPGSKDSPSSEEGRGFTYDGKQRFVIPVTRDVMSQLFVPWHWTLMQVVTWIFFTLNFSSYFANYSPWFYVCLALFWRAMYNVGLGYALKKQSESQVTAAPPHQA